MNNSNFNAFVLQEQDLIAIKGGFIGVTDIEVGYQDEGDGLDDGGN